MRVDVSDTVMLFVDVSDGVADADIEGMDVSVSVGVSVGVLVGVFVGVSVGV